MRQPFPKNYFCLCFPLLLIFFLLFLFPISNPILFPILSLFQGKLQFLSPNQLQPSSLFLLHPSSPPRYFFTPPATPPPALLSAAQAHKLLQKKKSPQTWFPRYALRVAPSHRALLLTLVPPGRYQRFRSYWPHCKLLSSVAPRLASGQRRPSKLELTRVLQVFRNA